MSDESVITTQNLTRYFGNKAAVYEVNLKVSQGCIFALLGRNGSGKTTLIRMLLGLLDPTRGSATVLGHDSRNMSPETRREIGYMPESHPLYPSMTPQQAGEFQSRFYPQWSNDIFQGVLDHFRIAKDSRARNLSRGERAGLSMALMLAGGPKLLILDDPALGLDPVARRSLMEILVMVTRKQNRTIFFTSHLVDDIERMADHIAVLDYSVLKAMAPMEEFRGRIKRVLLHFSGPAPQAVELPGLLQARINSHEIRATYVSGGTDPRPMLEKLNPAEIQDMPMSLEETIIAYMDRHKEVTRLQQIIDGEVTA